MRRSTPNEVISFRHNVITTIILAIILTHVAVGQTAAGDTLSLLRSVELTLAENPTIRIFDEQINFQEASLMVASGQFDYNLSSNMSFSRENVPLLAATQISSGISELSTEQNSYSVSLSRQFRSGLTISTQAGISRINDQLSNHTTPNYAGLNFVAWLPLLRGRGASATGSVERSTLIQLDASHLDLEYIQALQVLSTVQAYWGYRAAYNQLEILQGFEDRARKLVEETEVLIENGERPAADIKQLQANLADKISSRISAEQSLVEARHSLGLIIGIPADQIINLPPPSDSFPEANPAYLGIGEQIEFFNEHAFRYRPDFQASVQRQNSAETLREAAVSFARPQVDLSFSLGYSGLAEGSAVSTYLNSFSENVSGLNTAATLTFSLPTGGQKGAVSQQYALHEQSVIQTNNLARTMRSDIRVAVEDLTRSIQRYQRSKEAIELYLISVENEQQKLQLELSTIIDLIFVEDRLISARLNWVNAQLGYANALVALRYATGTLLSDQHEKIDITREHLISIPLPEEN